VVVFKVKKNKAAFIRHAVKHISRREAGRFDSPVDTFPAQNVKQGPGEAALGKNLPACKGNAAAAPSALTDSPARERALPGHAAAQAP
jgi:hypothetical protein